VVDALHSATEIQAHMAERNVTAQQTDASTSGLG
jgi:hypothetical protein